MSKVLIVGRPNVGKSSLFNRLVKQKQALVINQPGVTRDILKQKTSWWGRDFEVWDSGGLWSEDESFGPLINEKVKKAIANVDLVLFVMDGRTGLMEEDKQTFRLIKKSGKPFFTLVNKIDEISKTASLLSDFHSLGVSVSPAAFEKDRGVTPAVEWLIEYIEKKKKNSTTEEEAPKVPCILVAGKTNAGKSTLCNALLGEDRLLTSPKAGTTVDVVSDQFSYEGRLYNLLDTAGKAKFKKQDKAQSLATFKAHQSFKQADVILLLVDADVGIPGRQDAQLLDLCTKEHKAVILVVNKWDLVSSKKFTKIDYREQLREKFHFFPDIPMVFISALNAKGLKELMFKVDEIYKKVHSRVSTSELNRFFMDVIRKAPSPVYGTQDVKLYYLTQTHHTPPSFVAFANYPQGIRDSYRRFLIRQIQKKWQLEGVPIRISFLSKN